MKFKLEETDEIIESAGGTAIIGELFHKTKMAERLNKLQISRIKSEARIPNSDVVAAYLGILCQGEPDFEAIEQMRENAFFQCAMGLKTIPSPETVRQRLDQLGAEHQQKTIDIALKEICELIRKKDAQITPCFQNYVPLDMDVSPFDNSNTKKEGVSFTYKKVDGYAPMFAYLGMEGYCVNVELREGKQHCQNGTPEFIKTAIKHAKNVTQNPILVRLDSGNDSAENIAIMQSDTHYADFIIKRNPRKEDMKDHWYDATKNGREIKGQREGKRIFVYEETTTLKDCQKAVRVINFITERRTDAFGQELLLEEYELESYNTSLANATAEEIQELYHAHGTMEQFHSEIKTELDLERLPSGKFATNALVLTLGICAYNLLRMIGQASLLKKDYPPTARKIKRRRIRTVLLHYMKFAVKFVRHARTYILKMSRNNQWRQSFQRIYIQMRA